MFWKKKKIEKEIIKNKFGLTIMLLLLISISILLYLGVSREDFDPNIAQSNTSNGVVYPTQFSDKNITINAKIADPKFKELAVYDRNSQLANSISVIQKSEGAQVSAGVEKGTWLWTPIMDISPKYRDSIISNAKKNKITHIYLSIDSYLDIYVMGDGDKKTKIKNDFDSKIENFIIEANKAGIAVDAEAGWRNWAESGHEYKPFAVLDYAIRFNKTHTSKFRAIQYDVEPYLLDAYKKDKKKVLTNFLDLVNESVTRLNNSSLQFVVVIPEFYDGNEKLTPKFSYRGESGYAISHLLRVLDRRTESSIIVMSYRNFAVGKNGSIEISKGEIAEANSHSTKVILAQETGNVLPLYITFYKTSRKYYNNQVALLQKNFSEDKSFGGIAIHYVNAFMELR